MRSWPRGIRMPLIVILASIAAVAAIALGRTVATRLNCGPQKRSQLAEQVDGGTMEQHMESTAQKRALLRWIENGARRDEWDAIEPILVESCVPCHDAETRSDIVPLNQYSSTARVAMLRSLLAEKVEWGTMTRYLEGPGEKRTLLRWIENGAPETEWAETERILMERCVSCHNPETGVPGLVSLDRYPPTARIAFIPPSECAGGTIAAPVGALLLAAMGLYQMWRKKLE